MTKNKVYLAVGMLLSLLVFSSVFLPWMEFVVFKIDGYLLPELAKEQFGPSHWLVFATYLILVLPIVSSILFWRLVVFRKLRFPQGFLLFQMAVASAIVMVMLTYQFDPDFDIHVAPGAWMGCCGSVGLWVWQWRVNKRLSGRTIEGYGAS